MYYCGVFILKISSAIVFVPDDTSKTGLDKPLMLAEMMNCSLLRWVTEALWKNDVTRFFLVCHEKYTGEARGCFPVGAEVATAESENPSDLLHVFLSANDDDTAVVCVTKPVILLGSAVANFPALVTEPEPEPVVFPHMPIRKADPKPEPPETGIFILKVSELMDALDGDFHMLGYLDENGITGYADTGVYQINDVACVLKYQREANLDVLYSHIQNGVNIWDTGNCYIAPGVRIGKGSTLLPGTIITGETYIGEACVIGPNSLIDNCSIGEGTTVNASQLYKSKIGVNVKIGPFAYVRPDCEIGNNIKIGDFVEVKNSIIGDGTKISHLTYVGDSDVGSAVNIGCGTVTVNYDGMNKYRTTIRDEAFIGCNTNLIAPVTVNEGAYTAAGSTIATDVPPDSLAIARSRQTNKRDWVTKNIKR